VKQPPAPSSPSPAAAKLSPEKAARKAKLARALKSNLKRRKAPEKQG